MVQVTMTRGLRLLDPSLLVQLGNLVFEDSNGNSIADEGEGVDGVHLALFRQGDNPSTATPLATTITANGGHYLFSQLMPDSYFVSRCTAGSSTGVLRHLEPPAHKEMMTSVKTPLTCQTHQCRASAPSSSACRATPLSQ